MAASPLKKLIDGGVELADLSRKQIDTMAKQLAKVGDVRRKDAEQFVDELVHRSRETSDQFSASVEQIVTSMQREVGKQVALLAERFDELEDRLEDLAESLTGQRDGPRQSASRTSAPRSTQQSPAKKAPARKAPARKAPAKKSPAKKRKATADAATARKRRAPTKKAAAGTTARTPGSDSAVGSSGVRRIATSNPSSVER
jgi:polyhydroxyalkanoate synthesis regulator phasin